MELNLLLLNQNLIAGLFNIGFLLIHIYRICAIVSCYIVVSL